MPRIRTIKPEFWTDEKIVNLPFEARLLFIGLWNFADDHGNVVYSPERLRLQILPSDNIDIMALIDLLSASEMLDYWFDQEGTKAISIRNWTKHQKVDNPSRQTIIREGYRKVSIPGEARIAVAKKYHCAPGDSVTAQCYYCGTNGKIHWWTRADGKPSRWVTLSELEFDHFYSEHSGAETKGDNLVLACRSCNRSKREFDPHQFFSIKNSIPFEIPIDSSPLDQGSRIKEKEGKGKSEAPPIEATWNDDEEASIPDDLPAAPMGAYLLQRLSIPHSYSIAVKFADAVDLLARDEQCARGEAARRLLQRARAQPPNDGKWRFWLEDGGWKKKEEFHLEVAE